MSSFKEERSGAAIEPKNSGSFPEEPWQVAHLGPRMAEAAASSAGSGFGLGVIPVEVFADDPSCLGLHANRARLRKIIVEQ